MSPSSMRTGSGSRLSDDVFPSALCAIRSVVDPSSKLLDVERVRRVREILHEMDAQLACEPAAQPQHSSSDSQRS